MATEKQLIQLLEHTAARLNQLGESGQRYAEFIRSLVALIKDGTPIATDKLYQQLGYTSGHLLLLRSNQGFFPAPLETEEDWFALCHLYFSISQFQHYFNRLPVKADSLCKVSGFLHRFTYEALSPTTFNIITKMCASYKQQHQSALAPIKLMASRLQRQTLPLSTQQQQLLDLFNLIIQRHQSNEPNTNRIANCLIVSESNGSITPYAPIASEQRDLASLYEAESALTTYLQTIRQRNVLAPIDQADYHSLLTDYTSGALGLKRQIIQCERLFTTVKDNDNLYTGIRTLLDSGINEIVADAFNDAMARVERGSPEYKLYKKCSTQWTTLLIILGSASKRKTLNYRSIDSYKKTFNTCVETAMQLPEIRQVTHLRKFLNTIYNFINSFFKEQPLFKSEPYEKLSTQTQFWSSAAEKAEKAVKQISDEHYQPTRQAILSC